MVRKTGQRVLCLSSILIFLLTGSVGAASPDSPLYVFAAASLTDAINEIVSAYEIQSGRMVYANYAGSNTLKQQILHGMPADVFISADIRYVDELVKAGLVSKADISVLLNNTLVLVSGTKAKGQQIAALSELPALLGDEYLALADPDTVPAGLYAKEALINAGVWEAVKKRVVPALDVRAALALVDTGQAKYGMVYATDAALAKASQVAYQIPNDLHRPIQYGICLLNHDSSVAQSLKHFFMTEKAQKTFQRFGFVIP